MFQTLLAEFTAAWKFLVRIPLPAFLSGDGERSEYPAIDGHPALLRLMMPLIGFVLGFFAAVPLWILHLLPSGRLTAGIFGMAVIPLVLELAGSWTGLTSLSDFLNQRRQGASVEDALSAPVNSIDAPRSGISMILMMTLYFLRMVFCGILGAFAPFWLMIALTGAWLVRAQLASLERTGGTVPLFEVPRGLNKHHWYLAAGAMIVGGFLHPFGILIGFAVSWAVACLAGNICRDSISGVNSQAINVFGYAAELVLLFLGILFYTSF